MNFSKHITNDDSRALPLTTLIDVIFLLLIFFMVTSTLTPAESKLASALQAETAQGKAAADFQPQVVSVDIVEGQPAFTIGDRVMRTKAELRSVLERLPRESGVFVKGSGRVPAQSVAAALQACKDAGFIKITYVPAQ